MPICLDAHFQRVHLLRCAFSQLSIRLKCSIALLLNCLFHQISIYPMCPFDYCSTAYLPQVSINSTIRSRYGEHYKAEWSAHWTANLLSPGRCSVKSSTMMYILHYRYKKKTIYKKCIRNKRTSWFVIAIKLQKIDA